MNPLDPEQVLNLFAKTVDTAGYAGGIPNSLLARQDLEAEIVKLTNRNTPLRDMLPRIRGEGLAHLWNQRIALGALPGNNAPSELFYVDGGVPPESDPKYVQKTAAYKYLGVTGVITGPMIASGRSFADIEAEVAEAKLREVIQGEEWALFHGDHTVTNSSGASAFDGLDAQLTTNVVDNSGSPLTASGNTVIELDELIKKIRLQGGQPTHIFASFGQQMKVNQIMGAKAQYWMNEGTMVTGGIHAQNYQSTAGVMPLIGDFFINPAPPYPFNNAGSSGPTGAANSNIYIIQNGEIEMADLMPIGRTELAKVADTVRFYISEYTVLAVKAEPWMGIVKNVQEP
jgi:hypothetical protein